MSGIGHFSWISNVVISKKSFYSSQACKYRIGRIKYFAARRFARRSDAGRPGPGGRARAHHGGRIAARLRRRRRPRAGMVLSACSVQHATQECVPETVELKRQIFAELDAVADAHVVLASSSSCIAPSHFTEGSATKCLHHTSHATQARAPRAVHCGAPGWIVVRSMQLIGTGQSAALHPTGGAGAGAVDRPRGHSPHARS